MAIQLFSKNDKTRSLALVGALALASALMPRPARAVEVNPGEVRALGGTRASANPDLAGTVQADSLRPFEIRDRVGTVILRGSLQDRVVRSNNTGTLIFAPRLRSLTAPAGDAWITAVRVSGFGDVYTDVDFRLDGSGQVGPGAVSRSAGAGADLLLDHDPQIILPPDEQRFPSILTDAEHYAPVGRVTIYAQNDFGADVFSTTIEFTHVPDRDSDEDAMPDSRDLCPVVPDPLQGDLDRNGIGHLCECGDQNGDHRVNVSDIVAIGAAIYNPSLVTPLCDTNEDGLCNVRDVVGVNAKIFGQPAYCAARPRPGR
jgi:hypothetical protein